MTVLDLDLDAAPPCPWCGFSSVTEIATIETGSRRYTCGSCRRLFLIHLEPLAIEPLESFEPLHEHPGKDLK